MARVGNRAPIQWHLTNGALNKLLAEAYQEGRASVAQGKDQPTFTLPAVTNEQIVQGRMIDGPSLSDGIPRDDDA